MKRIPLSLLIVIILLAACSRPYSTDVPYIPVYPTYEPGQEVFGVGGATSEAETVAVPAEVMPPGQVVEATLTPFQPPTRVPGEVLPSPTPDQPKKLPTLRTREEKYTVQPSDTLAAIGRKYGVDINAIMDANQLTNPNLIKVGQVLVIPTPNVKNRGTDFKVLPDSELVLGPRTAGFSIKTFVNSKSGYLSQYQETVDGIQYSGAGIIERISREYSVNPRLLLAVLEYQSGWVTHSSTADNRRDYPIGRMETFRKGLYKQLAWASDMLNRGFYLWRVNGVGSWLLADGSVVPAAPDINAGTAGVQNFFSMLFGRADWDQAVSEKGLYKIFSGFFGSPFDYAFEPLLPGNLAQPKMQLPFERGTVWSFTGGPHGGWGSGSAWAAIDFAPPGEGGGCRASNQWVVAVTSGVIVKSEIGAVVQDLDGDGDERTGWSVLYMHIGSNDRVQVGTRLKAGDRIGHPSCEGGVSNGTHTHIARRYNGEWIPADGPIPFNLDGWISAGAGVEYYGSLTKDGQVLEPWDAKTDSNQISR